MTTDSQNSVLLPADSKQSAREFAMKLANIEDHKMSERVDCFSWLLLNGVVLRENNLVISI